MTTDDGSELYSDKSSCWHTLHGVCFDMVTSAIWFIFISFSTKKLRRRLAGGPAYLTPQMGQLAVESVKDRWYLSRHCRQNVCRQGRERGSVYCSSHSGQTVISCCVNFSIPSIFTKCQSPSRLTTGKCYQTQTRIIHNNNPHAPLKPRNWRQGRRTHYATHLSV